MLRRSVRGIEGVREAGAVDRLLVDPVDLSGLGQADNVEDGRDDVDAVGELRAQVAAAGDAPGPRDHHRVACAAQVAGHLLAPLERRVVGVRPGRGEVRSGVEPAQLVDPAVLVDEGELLLGAEDQAVEEGGLVERAGQRALHRRAVVAPDVDDERVVELAHLVDGIEQPAHVPVGVLGEPGEHLHLACVEPALRLRQAVPGGVGVGTLGQLGVGGHDAQALLTLERPLPVGVPSVVELPLVLVSPLLGDVVRGMRCARGVVDEPWLLSVLRAHGVQPLDRLVGDVVGEVVGLPVLALRHAEGRVVLGDDRVVLAGRAGEEAPPVVEAPAGRPVVERARRAELVPGRDVPLAEAAGDVAVLAQDAREGGARARPHSGVAREGARQLGDAAHPDTVVVASRQEGRPGGGADRRDVERVIGEPPLLHAREVRGADVAAEGVRTAEARVIDEHDEHVGGVLGSLGAHDHRPVAHRLVDGAARDAAERLVGDRQHRAVGVELAHRLGQLLLQLADAVLVALDDRLQRGAGEGLLDREPLGRREHADHDRGARLQGGAHLLLDRRGQLVAGEVADDRARGRADGHGAEHGRREQAHEHAGTAAPARPTAAQVVAGVHEARLSVGVLAHEDDALARELLRRHLVSERAELTFGDIDVGVSRDDEHLGVAHGLLPSAPAGYLPAGPVEPAVVAA